MGTSHAVRPPGERAMGDSAAAKTLLLRGLTHHRAGGLQEALTCYQPVLDIDPRQPDALDLVGVVAHQRGDHWLAVSILTRACSLDPVVALVRVMDGVVTAPTAVSSVAGAVGTRTWQLDSGSDWTVFGGRVSPWFRSIEVVARQPGEGSWDPAVSRLRDALTAWRHDGEPSC